MNIHMNRFASMFLLSLIVLLGACGRGESERLVITGATTVAPLINEIAKRYEQQHPGLRIDVQTGGSSRGINDVRAGLADIGMSSRSLLPAEAEVLHQQPIATDGLSLLVHADNPLRAIDRDQVIAVFRGEIRNWQELGGDDAPITVINRADGRSEVELMKTFFDLQPEDVAAQLISGENLHGILSVAGNPQAIIVMSLGHSEFEIAQGRRVRLLDYEGVEATSANVAAGTYPLTRPLMLITRPESTARVRDFIAYARSPAVHDLVQRQAYVPVAP